jgi:Fe-S cluster biogenesis protein NfuA
MSAGTQTREAARASAGAGVGGKANAEETGKRVEEILERIAATGDRAAIAAAEDLVRALMDFYGAGLARMLDLVGGAGAGAAQAANVPAPLERLLGDELVSSLLVLHDLHPEDLPTRISRAIDALPGKPVELVGFEELTGTVRVKASAAGGCGCPSTEAALRQPAEDALACFAPEVTSVQVEGPSGADKQTPLLQISVRPGLEPAAS